MLEAGGARMDARCPLGWEKIRRVTTYLGHFSQGRVRLGGGRYGGVSHDVWWSRRKVIKNKPGGEKSKQTVRELAIGREQCPYGHAAE